MNIKIIILSFFILTSCATKLKVIQTPIIKGLPVEQREEEIHWQRGRAHLDSLSYVISRSTENRKIIVEKAIQEFNQAIYINPKYKPAYEGLSNAYNALGNIDKMLEIQDKLIELSSTDKEKASKMHWKASLLRTKKKYEEAVDWHLKALSVYLSKGCDLVNIYLWIGDVYFFDLKKEDLAKPYFLKAIEECKGCIERKEKINNSGEDYFLYYMAHIHQYALRNYEKAIKDM